MNNCAVCGDEITTMNIYHEELCSHCAADMQEYGTGDVCEDE